MICVIFLSPAECPPAYAAAREAGRGSTSRDTDLGGGGTSPELESLVGQILEELVRDATWGLPTHSTPDAAAGPVETPLTPQV